MEYNLYAVTIGSTEAAESSRTGSDTGQEEERVRVEVMAQMLSLRVPASQDQGQTIIFIIRTSFPFISMEYVCQLHL